MKHPTPVKLQETVLRLFDQARARHGQPYDADRFLAFLTQPPAPAGRRVADTFEGRRRLVRFMDSVQLEFGMCFSNDEWERGFTLDQFVDLVEAKIAKPEAALQLARQRLKRARVALVDEPIKFGLLALPLLVGAIAFHPLALRVILGALWAAIVGTVLIVDVGGYKYAQKLVGRIAMNGNLRSVPPEEI